MATRVYAVAAPLSELQPYVEQHDVQRFDPGGERDFLLQLRRHAVERAEVPGTVGRAQEGGGRGALARGVVRGGTRLVAQGASFRGS